MTQTMERSTVLDAWFDKGSKLKLYGMKAVYDEVLTTAVKRQHEPQQIIHCPAGDCAAICREGVIFSMPRLARNRHGRSNIR